MSTTETEKILIAPSTDSILAEIAREKMDWETALGEVIDNSLDAGATRVVVLIDKKLRRVRVTDNGSGCSEPHRMFVSGYSTKRGRKDMMGRYGVGLKHSSFWFCGKDGITTVVSSRNGQHRYVRVVWNDLLESGRWEIDAPKTLSETEVSESLPDRCGTQITFGNLTPGRGFPSKDQLAGVMRKLAFTFSPALRNGRQIEFRVDGRVMPLSAPSDPVWAQSVGFEVAIDSHRARCRVGILAANDGSNRRGLSFCFGHRVIVADSGHGCGSYGTQGFAGTVILDENWHLGQNKSEVIDALWGPLGDAILEHTQPLLEKLSNEMRVMHSDALRIKTAGVLNELLGPGLGEAKRPNKRGGRRKPTTNKIDRTVGNAAIVAGKGPVSGRRTFGGGLIIDWDDQDDVAWGARAETESNRVYLNRRKEWVRIAFESGDSNMLALIAASHWFSALSMSPHSGPLFKAQSYAEMMGSFLSRSMSLTIVGQSVSA